MKVILTAVLPRRSQAKSGPTDLLLTEYSKRVSHYIPFDSQSYETEAAFLASLERQPGRPLAHAVLLDSRGRQFTSEDFAARLGSLRDTGTQRLVLAIGPADGWSAAARERADLLFSLGLITLPHQLARVVLAEQLYRALTILAGHPYHAGH
jgi:23S rRNA (pseudouridine1915-N3)-methyltransferase